MNNKILLFSFFLLSYTTSLVAAISTNYLKLDGDSTNCILFFELDQVENGDYTVSVISDTTWTFPRNIVSTAQVTIKVPTGGFLVGDIQDLINGVAFFKTGRDNAPIENPTFDYISFSLGSQGTSRITFEKGMKVPLFSFNNTGTCPDGTVTLMDNFTDPFYPPNSKQSNAGQQMTVSGFGAPDLPVGIRGNGISCNPMDTMTTTPPVDTMTTTPPVDTMTTTPPVDTMTTTPPVDTMTTTPPVDTMTTTPPVDTMTTTPPVDTMTTTPPVDTMTTTPPVDTMTTTPPVDTMTTTPPVDTMTTTPPVDTMTTTPPVDTMTTTPPVDTMSATPPIMNSGLSTQIAVQNISCKDAEDGIIILKTTNGQPPYTFQWNTGATTSNLENLAPGTYTVTITDQTGFSIEQSASITEADILTIVFSKSNVTQAGATDGRIRAIVTGGAAPYTYSWNNGVTVNALENLGEGTYSLIVADALGCVTEKSTTIIDQSQCETINVALDLKPASCAGDNNGEVMVTPNGGTAPYEYAWEIGANKNVITNIPSGNYMVTVTDNIGCTMAVSTMLQDPPVLTINLTTVNGNGNNDASITSEVTGGMRPYSYQWSNGATTNNITNLAGGTYALTLTDGLGCETVVHEVINGATSSCSIVALAGVDHQMVMDQIACDEKGTICLPIPKDSMIHYSIFLNGEDYSSNLKGCQFETYYVYSYAFFPGRTTSGNYTLREWMINDSTYTGSFSSISDLVNSMNTWDPQGNWINLADVAIIQGGNPNNTYGAMVLVDGGISTILDASSNETPTGTEITFKPGIHELILIENRTTCSDTIAINLPCAGESRDSIINITIAEGAQLPICLAASIGDGFQISDNTCPDESGTAVIINYNAITGCIEIFGLMAGTEQACYQVTTASGLVINLRLNINVQANTIECITLDRDTLFAFAPSCDPIQACLALPFSLLSTANITLNGAAYTGTINTCSSNGVLLTFENAGPQQLRIEYGESCVLDLVVIIGCDEDRVIEETIDIDRIDVVCLTLPGLLGIYTSVENICPEKGNKHVLFEPLSNSGCISYTSLSIGSDTACIKACDIFGFCDTVTIIYHVEDLTGTPPPIFQAVNDSTSIRLNGSAVLDVLANDTYRSLDTFYLVNEPATGQLFLNPDDTYTYIAQTGSCNDDEPVTFNYAICENTVCDTATVSIYISCSVNSELVVYNALSPNDDGVNDSFRIDGIENYPSNSVQIFNRWGNRVFSQDGYKNEWDGTWDNRKVLPDGTYFYRLDLGDGSKPLSGFLEIRR